MVAAWCFLLDIGPQSLGPRREVDIALRSLCQALENLELNFCNTLQVFWCILFLHFFWIHWRSQKKMNLKSNVMNSLKSRSTFQTSVSKGWRRVGGLAQDRTLECHSQRYRDTSGDAALSSIFFVSKNSQLQRRCFFAFRDVFWWRHATHQNTPKDHQNEKRKTKTTSLSKLSHLQPHQDFPHFPLQYHRPTFPQTGCRCGHLPYPFYLTPCR